jgi:hypothetical protein
MQNDPYNPMSPIQAFTTDEETQVQGMLETLIRCLRIVPGGGKMEEGYWSYIYHTIRNAPISSWSNLPMRDFLYEGLGVEMKLLQRQSPLKASRQRIMHPSATRTLLFDPTLDAETCKVQILEQFATRIADFRKRAAQTCSDCKPDIRWGVFLWNTKLNEFLYFEERIREPNPNDFYARFNEGKHRGNPTRNLHIFEKETNIKRYSITMPNNGAKLQPYFDVPSVGQGAYAFKVPNDSRKPIWLAETTIEALQHASKSGNQSIDELIISALKKLQEQ